MSKFDIHRKRLELQETLEEVLGSRNVYFQPPSNVKMKYPAIVYERSRMDARHANNDIYKLRVPYTVTVIDKRPDSDIPERMLELPYCSSDRRYTSDNLYHDVFTLYY